MPQLPPGKISFKLLAQLSKRLGASAVVVTGRTKSRLQMAGRMGIDAAVVPMGCRAEHYPVFLRSVFTLANIRGALITMPHKVAVVDFWASWCAP